MERRFIMMKQTFMKLNLSCRLFMIIIVLFLIPYLSLFSWAYRKAESIIRTKAQSLEKENLSQTRNDIENLCLNIAKASDYLISLDHYGVLYRESEQRGYTYLKCWQYVDEQIQNANNALLNSSADISVLSKDRLLYSTLSYQKFRYQDFSENRSFPLHIFQMLTKVIAILKMTRLLFPISENFHPSVLSHIIW